MQPPLNCKVVSKRLVVKWCVVVVVAAMVGEVVTLTGPHVCVEKQKYNITKRVKYRAPMSIRTYEWCLAIPPRCSKWSTEVRDLTKLENEERTAEVEVCCAGHKIEGVSCVPICPYGKTGNNCALDCPASKWGPNCVYDCKPCRETSTCSPYTGQCVCRDGWTGESCEISMSTTTTTTTQSTEILTTAKITTPQTTTVELTTTPLFTESSSSTTKTTVSTASTTLEATKPLKVTTESRVFTTVSPTPAISPTLVTKPLVKENKTKSSEKESFYYRVPIFQVTSQSPPTIHLMMTTQKAETKESSNAETTKQATETTRKTEATPKHDLTTIKFKPKEIWIRPATKGESSTETRIKQDTHAKHRNATKKEIITITTPRTILVSIIPTSISYSLHKRILSSTHHTPSQLIRVHDLAPTVNGSLPISTTTPIPVKLHSPVSSTSQSPSVPVIETTEAITTTPTTLLSTTLLVNTTLHVRNRTNSMTSTNGLWNSSSLTTSPTVLTTINSKLNTNVTENPKTEAKTILTTAQTTVLKQYSTKSKIKETTKAEIFHSTPNNLTQNSTNAGNAETHTGTTQSEETFPILTEPEHITAIATDKAQERTSVDLISVLSIAGGVMFAVITVAVIIVMIERCRRPRYEDVRKNNNIRMNVLMVEDDLPPPYVRSIFHTPLPEPPVGEKCHYQPISTLDRNLKQFMRPVVVQTISPIMIENFRGILECHYDHLPRRSHAFDSSQCDLRCSLAPSVSSSTAPLCSRATSMIDASKCEAKLDEIDCTTSEPLYAEIPAWKPPSEHAIEVMNFNGEACTEL